MIRRPLFAMLVLIMTTAKAAIRAIAPLLTAGLIWVPGVDRLQAQNCNAAYPSVCIPPPPPDLDCSDIRHRNFVVLQPDPHRFDGDFDGLGCELSTPR